MKVFLDANVLIAVLNKEYPVFSHAARVLSLDERADFTLVTSSLCLAIAYYFSEKKSGATVARSKIALLASRVEIAGTDGDTVAQAVGDKRVQDFEDGLEYYAALQAGCEVIVTEDRDGFYFSAMPVVNCADFLERYVFSR